jgi:FtsZ-binding cell division protein ZapB
MFNIFKNLFKMSTKQELEQQLNEAIAVAQRLNEEIKVLRAEKESLRAENEQLQNDFASAVERVRYLDGQVKMLESQRQASTKYSDSSKKY